MPSYHPHLDDQGQPVVLEAPSSPTPLSTWADPTAIARVVPQGPLPEVLNGLALRPYREDEAPGPEGPWEAAEATRGHGPTQGMGAGSSGPQASPLTVSPGKPPAAGAVVVEPDGRVWVVHPSNAFGGYQATFPKGKQAPGLSLEQTAIQETFEEAGLVVTLTRWLVDVPRSTSMTRYYLAQRIGGSPAAMGWESQAVSLVPIDRLHEVVTHPNDTPILEALHHA
ncbi:MAG: NUDIX hydrolase [Pseudomonadota bacterium]